MNSSPVITTLNLGGSFCDEEWKARVDLAACYRLADRNRMSKVIWNHISARVPGNEEHFLINRFGLRYDEITASNLLKVDANGKVIDGDQSELNFTGYVIHSAVHRARPEVSCVMHTHSRGGMGVAALEGGFLHLCQESTLFFDDIAYHDYEGLSDDEEERERIAQNLGQKHQLILRNHGLLTVGQSVGEAYWRMFYLELSCSLQLEVLATGQPYQEIPPKICRKGRRQYEEGSPPGHFEWPALLRLLDDVCPDYAT